MKRYNSLDIISLACAAAAIVAVVYFLVDAGVRP